MINRIAADAVLVFHLAFIVFAVAGAALVFCWRHAPLVHLPAAAWAVFVELTGRICPLTYLENDLRRMAGDSGYSGSFIEHYLLGIIYPTGLSRNWQLLAAAVVILCNLILYGLYWRRRKRTLQSAGKRIQHTRTDHTRTDHTI